MDRRVLLVDDDLDTVKLVQCHLHGAGYQVLTATNAHDAMRVLLDDAPPILVTDWEMPDMSGLELCRTVRGHEGIRFVYVIILTAHVGEDRLVEAFEAGVDDYVTKSGSERELLARLRAAERIVSLEADLARKTREVYRYNAEMELANRKLEIANEKLHLAATTDELTGLINRREAMRRLTEHWALATRHGEPLACISADIDHFKLFNDTYGHAIGDQVLRQTAAALRETARAEDVVCRVGGEEFLVLCPRSAVDQAMTAAERLRCAVEACTHVHGGTRLHVTISAGVAERLPSMTHPYDLLLAVDRALYDAKRAGRNRVAAAAHMRMGDVGEASSEDGAGEHLAGTHETRAAATRVLIVGAKPSAASALRRRLRPFGFAAQTVANMADALTPAGRNVPEAVVLVRGEASGDIQFQIQQIRAQVHTAGAPIVVIDGAAAGSATEVLGAGADDYLAAPPDLRELALRLSRLIERRRETDKLRHATESRHSAIVTLARLAETRDCDQGRHLQRMTRYCDVLARRLRAMGRHADQISDGFLRDLARAVPLHDIGKIAIPDAILLKPGKLTQDEIVVMRSHAQIGRETIRCVAERFTGIAYLRMAEEIAHAHHERYDGSGYPRGLRGDEIPLAARIVALADTYDAITTRHVYQEARPHETAVQCIRDGAGTQFDPDVVAAFLQCRADFHRHAVELGDAPEAERGVTPPLQPVPSLT